MIKIMKQITQHLIDNIEETSDSAEITHMNVSDIGFNVSSKYRPPVNLSSHEEHSLWKNVTWLAHALHDNVSTYFPLLTNFSVSQSNFNASFLETDFNNTSHFNNYSSVEANCTFIDGKVTNGTNCIIPSTIAEQSLLFIVLASTVLGVLILLTIIGNVFVIAAILLERNLQSVGNYLVCSLAAADLLVSVLVMPLGAVYEVNKEWIMGPELCDMWTASDVLCCSSSILHLLAIAIDRYWSVTNLNYIQMRTARRINVMIVIVWLVAFAVSILPVFGWKDPNFYSRIYEKKQCLLSQDIGYQIFATFSTFFIPLVAILILYWKIFQAARKRIRRKDRRRNLPQEHTTTNCTRINETTAFSTVNHHSSNNASPEKSSGGCTNCSNSQQSNMSEMSKVEMLPKKEKKSQKEHAEHKREKKAAKTLAIITGVFIICWMPFFVSVLATVKCPDCMHPLVNSLLMWLGYCNSLLNPIIYTIFSPDFRNAFKKILFGKTELRRRRLRQ